jgi:transcriptional regulator with XRE-family HTH domain
MTDHKTTRGFGSRLRWWRERRGLSQLELANAAEVSQRHVSFLENGRTKPSRDMALRLVTALDLPLRQQNAFLLAAGYAPMWRETEISAPELAVVNRALDHMLTQQEPYPAFVVDRWWNLLRANSGAEHLVELLTGTKLSGPVNLADALISPAALRPLIANWSDVALYFLRGVQADAIADGTSETAALLRRLLSYSGVPALAQAPSAADRQAPVLNIHFAKGEISLRMFTTIATLGAPLDVTLQEIRVECFFPADPETAKAFRDRPG